MKRLNNLYKEICSLENLQLADKIARKGKSYRSDIKLHDLNRNANLLQLSQDLLDKTYKTSRYSTFKIYEPKERIVYRSPYYPDRIIQHAIMNVLRPVLVSMFTADTYSCIPGRGIHSAINKLSKVLKNVPGTTYCLKLDIRKFYPSVDHAVLKALLRNKFKDNDLLWLLDEIINSAAGIPIGNYLSQYLANFYMTGFDHWIKENRQVKYYFRYADDIVILSGNKSELHKLLFDIKQYLSNKLKLTVKDNYQIFPVAARGIDFLGYVCFHDHRRLRKEIKQNYARMLKIRRNPASIASYNGWVKYCNGKHLQKKFLQKQF